MNSIKEYAYAKINLYLNITDKRDDGFHDLITIMQLVSLHDVVELKLNAKPQHYISFTNVDFPIEPTKNLAYIAVEKFYERLNKPDACKVTINIKKKIPVASGLAGGSADAGAVLRGLNKLFNDPFTIDELCEIASEIGSDVPFCTKGGVQLCTSRGEVMSSMKGLNHVYILLAQAGEKQSTAEQFKQLDDKFESYTYDDETANNFLDLCSDLFGHRYDDSMGKMYNIFEELYKDDEKANLIKSIMLKRHGKFAMLSGSGPTIFGIYESDHDVQIAKRHLSNAKIKSIVCHPINREYSEITDTEMPWDHYCITKDVFKANRERRLNGFKIKY